MFYVAVSNSVANVGLCRRLAFKCMKVADTPVVIIRWQPATSCVLASDGFVEDIGSHWIPLDSIGSIGSPSHVA